ncbi:MAG: hypothetical protein IJ053_03845 [Lachnospiraceae bacterium]|nr:hypothetical protein [Lachnospiraceae bacterium]
MDGITILIVLVFVVAIAAGVIIGLNNKKLFDTGVANKKRSYDFYEQEHTFKTLVPNIDTLLNAMDRNTLGQEGISISKDSRRLVFRNSAGTFTASIVATGNSRVEGVHLYKFRVNSWKEKNGMINMSARVDSNVVLTAIEKAFLTLDFNAVVERVYATDLKTKSSFF